MGSCWGLVKQGCVLIVLVVAFAAALLCVDEVLASDDSLIATTPEGTWLQTGSRTLYLQGFSPYSFAFNLSLLAGTKMLSYFSGSRWLPASSHHWLHWAGQAAGALGAGWYLSSLLDEWEIMPGSEAPLYISTDIPEVSSRLVLFMARGRGAPILVILRNPYADPLPLNSTKDPVTRRLLSIHREMVSRSLNRLEVSLFHDAKGAGFRLGWRTEAGEWLWLHPGVRFSPEIMALWLESVQNSTASDSVNLYAEQSISLFQPDVLEYLLNIIKRGRSAGLQESVTVPTLTVERTDDGFWSSSLSAGDRPIVLEGVSLMGQLKALKLLQVGEKSEADSPIYHVPRSWTAGAQALMNVAFLGLDMRKRPPSGRLDAVDFEDMSARLDLLKAGKIAGVGLGATTAREVKGEPQEFKVAHLGRLHDSNKIVVSSDVHAQLQRDVDLPWNLELTGNEGRKGWASLDGATSEDDHLLYMSEHMMNRLNVRAGDDITMQPVLLNKVREIGVQVVQGSVRDQEQMRGMLEQALDRRYQILHEGEIIRLQDNNENFAFRVEHLYPEGAVYTPRTEPRVYIKRPDDWPIYISSADIKSGGFTPFFTRGHVLETGHVAPPIPVEDRVKWKEKYPGPVEKLTPEQLAALKGQGVLGDGVVDKVVLSNEQMKKLVARKALIDKGPGKSEKIIIRNAAVDEVVVKSDALGAFLDKIDADKPAPRFNIVEKLGDGSIDEPADVIAP